MKQQQQELKSEQLYFIDLLSGSLSGAITRFIVAPLDVVKIRLQLQSTPAGSVPKYTGISQAFSRIFREEGLRALWRGNLSAEALWISYASSQFTSYQAVIRYLDHDNYVASKASSKHYKPPTQVSLIAGAVAGVVSTIDGYRSMYKGLTSSLLQIVPQMGIQFALYEGFVQLYVMAGTRNNLRTAKEVDSDPLGHLLCGASAGGLAKFCVLPFDVVKKRLQVAPNDLSMRRCITTMYRQEGWNSFFKAVQLVKSLPTISSVDFALI
eukprot:gene12401-14553_t